MPGEYGQLLVGVVAEPRHQDDRDLTIDITQLAKTLDSDNPAAPESSES
jgi:hypothetical protein